MYFQSQYSNQPQQVAVMLPMFEQLLHAYASEYPSTQEYDVAVHVVVTEAVLPFTA